MITKIKELTTIMMCRAVWICIFSGLISLSCKHTVVVNGNGKSIPPGHMKKMTGSQSAKSFAPGQQKKK